MGPRLVAAACVALSPPVAALAAGFGEGPAAVRGSPAAGHADGPPPGHTGGFGEPSCHRCHFDRPVNASGADVDVTGLPDAYRPGRSYRLEVRLRGAELERGGFQLSARCAGAGHAGRQAGVLEGDGSRVEIVEGTGEPYRGAENVEYARHTATGTKPTAPGEASWSVRWRAPRGRGGDGVGPPAGECGAVAVHVAANAANGDDSEFGDRIRLRSVRVDRGEDSRPGPPAELGAPMRRTRSGESDG